MTKSELRNIIREIIRQDVPRSTEKSAYGMCVSKKKCNLRHENCSVICGHHPQERRCTYDEDCDEHCWCNHSSR